MPRGRSGAPLGAAGSPPGFDPRLSSRNLVSAALRRPRRVLMVFLRFSRGAGARRSSRRARRARARRAAPRSRERNNEFDIKGTLPYPKPTPRENPRRKLKNSISKPPYPRRLDEGCLDWKKRKRKICGFGQSRTSQLRRRRIRFGNWMIPLNMFNGGSQTVKPQILGWVTCCFLYDLV